jgi:four helix bundle protein
MPMANDFTDLLIWQRSSDLLKEAVMDIESFPSKVGARQLGDQLFRSVSAISANIAEGFGRRTRKELVRSCAIARGEIDESRNWYFQCERVGLLKDAVVKERSASLIELRKMISSFIAKTNAADTKS